MRRFRLRHLGQLIALIAIAVLGHRLLTHVDQLPPLPTAPAQLILLTASLMVYIAAALPAAAAWHALTRRLLPNLPWTQSLVIWCIAQIGKYLPGNVAQHVARVSLVSHHGAAVPGSTAVQFIETLIALPAAALCTLLASSLSPFPLTSPYVLAMAGVLLGAMLLLFPLGRLPTWLARRWTPFATMAEAEARPPALLSGLILQSLAMACGGLSFAIVVHVLVPEATLDTAALVARFVVAWLAGYVIVGAPAGVGVREGALVVLLAPHLSPEQALGAALLHRVIALLGDLLLLSGGSLAWRTRVKPA